MVTVEVWVVRSVFIEGEKLVLFGGYRGISEGFIEEVGFSWVLKIE